MMVGLAAPAFAAPAVTSFTPTSGPAGCVVVVTGTGFKASPAAQISVNFISTGTTIVATASKTIISDTELWATVPAAGGGFIIGADYAIRVDDALLGTGTASTTRFLLTSAAGGCAPTITSFTPTCGVTGDVVVITGTNLLAPGELPGVVEFAPYSGALLTGIVAQHTVPDVDGPTSLSVLVPGTTAVPVADGPITVKTFDTDAATLGVQGGKVQSTTLFLTPPPDCVAPGGTTHPRSVSFKIKSTGKASGVVKSTEDTAFTDCVAAVPVKIQRKTSSGWKTVGKTTTTDTGSYAKKVKNPKGKQKFRALAPKVSLGDPVTDVCSKAKSATRKV
jgi:hypothetical protein